MSKELDDLFDRGRQAQRNRILGERNKIIDELKALITDQISAVEFQIKNLNSQLSLSNQSTDELSEFKTKFRDLIENKITINTNNERALYNAILTILS
jgi:hypothetical protein